MGTRRRQPELRHVSVDALILAGLDHIGFVPDANASAGTHCAIESLPGLEVVQGRIAGKPLKLLERSPVLNERHAAPVDERLGVHQAEFLVREQMFNHRTHGPCDWQPFVDCEKAIDAHADDEDDKRPVHLCSEAAGENLAHRFPLTGWW